MKDSVYCNKYKPIPNKNEVGTNLRGLLDPSYQGVKRLFVLAYDNTEGDNRVSGDSHEKIFSSKSKCWKLQHWNWWRNFYDQPINDLIKQYDEVRKVSIGQGDDCTTGSLLYFLLNYRLIVVDQKALDADSRSIQQISFTGTVNITAITYYTIEQSKETILQFSKGTTKVL